MNSKNPQEYEVYDFLMDDRFINYYFKRNTEDFNFWREILESHPDLQPHANYALEMLHMLTLRVPESEFREELKKLENSISKIQVSQGDATLIVSPERARWSRRKRIAGFLTAASFLIIGISVLMIKVLNKPDFP